MIYLIIGLVLLVILLLVINFLYYKNKFNFYFLKVEEADNNIELILEKKIEILLKIAKIIDKDMEKELEEFKKKEEPVVFIFWGNYARAKKVLITNPKHLVLESAHPSPFSAYNGFFGSRPFSKTNEFLIANGIKPIDWNIEKDL